MVLIHLFIIKIYATFEFYGFFFNSLKANTNYSFCSQFNQADPVPCIPPTHRKR